MDCKQARSRAKQGTHLTLPLRLLVRLAEEETRGRHLGPTSRESVAAARTACWNDEHEKHGNRQLKDDQSLFPFKGGLSDDQLGRTGCPTFYTHTISPRSASAHPPRHTPPVRATVATPLRANA